MNNNGKEGEEEKYKLNFDFTIPKDYLNSFQSIFSYIKKKYQIKFCRKSQIDSLLKKCKGKFFKTIHDIMNNCLTTIVKRLPQIFITNINIEYNKNYFEKTVYEIYQEFNNFPDFNSFKEKNLIKPSREKLFSQFCNISLYSLYDIYCESQRFKNDINDVHFQEGKRIGILYEFVSLNFSAYYKYSRPHQSKIKIK